MNKSYRYLPHTADIKVEAWGNTLEEAFASSALALENTTVEIENVDQVEEREIFASGSDLYELLYNFLEKLIIDIDVDQMVYSYFKVNILKKDDEYYLTCMCKGEKLNPSKHHPKIHIKAITYHEMEIIKENGRYIIRYVLDI